MQQMYRNCSSVFSYVCVRASLVTIFTVLGKICLYLAFEEFVSKFGQKSAFEFRVQFGKLIKQLGLPTAI